MTMTKWKRLKYILNKNIKTKENSITAMENHIKGFEGKSPYTIKNIEDLQKQIKTLSTVLKQMEFIEGEND